MTPEGKAEELFGIYLIYTENQTLAKKCSLIAVDEMLANAGMIWGWDAPEKIEFKKYWKEVKQEIDKL